MTKPLYKLPWVKSMDPFTAQVLLLVLTNEDAILKQLHLHVPPLVNQS